MDQVTWRSEAVVHLVKFPGDHRPAALELVVECANQTAVVGSAAACTLAEIGQALDAAIDP